MRIRPLSVALVVVLGSFFSLNAVALTASEIKVTHYFDSIKSNPDTLCRFLKSMPKGGDLHNHVSGSIYAENLVDYAKNDGFCINKHSYTVYTDPQCGSNDLLTNAIKQPSFYDMLIDSWSIRNFQSTTETAPDHFFSSFSKFGAIVKKHQDLAVTDIVKQAASDHELYLELMLATDGNQSGHLGKELGWDNDFNTMRDRLLSHNFDQIIQSSAALLNQIEATKKKLLGCKGDKTKPACAIEVRYLYQVSREQAPEMVFAQMLAGFEIAKKDRRVVGLNLVQAEQGQISMRDYSLHMRMMAFLHKLYPEIAYSLHAGELNEALVAPQELTFHINEAVHVAASMRIGHGVDIFYENDLEHLLNTMAKREILVEINLSSNDFILNVKGDNHPLPLYVSSGVPVTLSTDDQGINRSNLSKEYQQAVAAFDFDYLTLKNFARNSLNYSFLKGKKLWLENSYLHISPECAQDSPNSEHISQRCEVFLKSSEKAALQWELERQFDNFEKNSLK